MDKERFEEILAGAMLKTDEGEALYNDFLKMGEYISRVAQSAPDGIDIDSSVTTPPIDAEALRESCISASSSECLEQSKKYREPYVEIPRVV